jgi:hypothetical protein
VITEATWAAQGAGIVVAVVAACVAGCIVVDRRMRSDAKPRRSKPRPEPLSGAYLPLIAIQPDGSVYVRPDRQRLGGATVAPRLRGGGR